MNWKSPHLWIGICSCIAVFSVAMVDVGKKSPGELSLVHGRIPELNARNACSDCHGGWASDMKSSCLECHDIIGAQLERNAGLHGILDSGLADNCAACHSDHHGEGFAIVNGQSFRLAGVEDPALFDHERIGFVMEGEHTELACTECHENAELLALPEGAQRFGGLSQSCASCHEDVHEGTLSSDCAECHVQTSFETLFSKGHDDFLPLLGGHGEIGCRECHATDDGHALEVVTRSFGEKPMSRECTSCHESPHAESFIEGIAQQSGTTKGQSCATCHVSGHLIFQEESIEVSTSQHAASGFKLDAPHDESGCADCHGEGVLDIGTGHVAEADHFATRFPGRDAAECSRCHEDVHEGQFAEGPFAREECTACHDNQHFEPHAFTASLHERTEMPLEGAHVETECSACHEKPNEGLARIFHGTESNCEACHDDAHRGFFDALLQTEEIAAESPLEGECARCHDATAFSGPETDATFDHGLWALFEIDGAHLQGAGCESCHARSESPDEFGRRFGFVREHFGTFEGCFTCHEDPHEGQFDHEPLEIEGRRDCARCHQTTSFRALQPNVFDHGEWTGFELRGAHSEARCSSCHEPIRGAAPGTRNWNRAAGNDCASCHETPHGGQFETLDILGQSSGTDCSRCHQDGHDFTPKVFDHDIDSRFPLDDAHEELACADCHKPEFLGGRELIRYRPLGRECTDCHGVQRSPLRRRKGRVR